MKLKYDQESNGMYKLHKSDFDDIALTILREHLPAIIDLPKEVDINYLVHDCMYLDMYSKYLSPNKSVLGLIAFADTNIPCYDLHFNPSTFSIKEGTIVIDLSLSGCQQLPRRRFTIAHELSHWILHRSFHSPTNQQYELRTYKCYSSSTSSNIERKYKKLETDSDREEWQANSLATAILMPKFAFLSRSYSEIHRQFGTNRDVIMTSDDYVTYKSVINNIAETFNVSFQAAEIRLDQLNFIK